MVMVLLLFGVGCSVSVLFGGFWIVVLCVWVVVWNWFGDTFVMVLWCSMVFFRVGLGVWGLLVGC